MSDLRDRVPGQSLIEVLLDRFEKGQITRRDDGEIEFDPEERGWYWGVQGERIVARLLAELGEGWHVLHSIPAGSRGRDIDHLVIGPPGVVTINTKNAPGKAVWAAGRTLIVDGNRTTFTQRALDEVRHAESRLSASVGMTVPIRGLIVLISPGPITRKNTSGDQEHVIEVIGDRELLAALRRRRELSDDQVTRIAQAAATPGTWDGLSTTRFDDYDLDREFLALEEAVGDLARPSRSAVGVGSPPRPGRERSTRPERQPVRVSRPRRGYRRRRAGIAEKLVGIIAMPLLGLIAYALWSAWIAAR